MREIAHPRDALMGAFKLRRMLCAVLCCAMLLLTACRGESITMTPTQFLDSINTLSADDFGAITETDTIDAVTTLCQITERLSLTLISDPVTGLLQRAELALTFDADITDLDYASFSYFFLVMLKAYDKNITISNVNSIHDALLIEIYDAGTDTKIGYGSSTYAYRVTDAEARFCAQFIAPAETLDF